MWRHLLGEGPKLHLKRNLNLCMIASQSYRKAKGVPSKGQRQVHVRQTRPERGTVFAVYLNAGWNIARKAVPRKEVM